MSPNHPFLHLQETLDQRVQGDRNFGQDLGNIFRLTAAPQGAAPSAPASPEGAEEPERVRAAVAEPRRISQPDLDAALDMLNRAAKAMDLMQSRYQHVEAYAKSVAERAEKDIALAYDQAREWEAKAAGSEGKVAEFRNRAEAAEQRAEAAERSAKEARDWLECFYDRIVSSFDTRNLLKSQAA